MGVPTAAELLPWIQWPTFAAMAAAAAFAVIDAWHTVAPPPAVPPTPAPRVEPESEEEVLRIIAQHALRMQILRRPDRSVPTERPRRTTRVREGR